MLLATEIELKLQVLDEKVNVVEKLKAFLAENGGECQFQQNELVNIYFDTPDWDLNANKMALRIRHKHGKYIQTLKTKGQSIQGLSQRGEWEWRVPDHKLDQGVLKNCEAWPKSIDLDSLVAVFETNFTRHHVEFTWQGSEIELAFDLGSILSQGKVEKIREIELELKVGKANDLHLLAEGLQRYLPLAPSDISKAERGYRLFSR